MKMMLYRIRLIMHYKLPCDTTYPKHCVM